MESRDVKLSPSNKEFVADATIYILGLHNHIKNNSRKGLYIKKMPKFKFLTQFPNEVKSSLSTN